MTVRKYTKAAAEAQKRYDAKFTKITLRLTKEEYESIKQFSKDNDENMASFVRRACKEIIEQATKNNT